MNIIYIVKKLKNLIKIFLIHYIQIILYTKYDNYIYTYISDIYILINDTGKK